MSGPTGSGIVLQSLCLRALETPESHAVLAPGLPPLTFASLWDHIERTSRALAGAGLGPGDVVAAALPDIEELTAFLGVHAAAGFAPLNPGLKEGEFEAALRTLAPQALLVPEGTFSPAATAARSLGVPVYEVRSTPDRGAGSFDIAGPAPVEDAATPPDPASLALLLLTSATTGRAKGVCIARSNMEAALQVFPQTLGLTRDDRFLVMMPMFHLQGLLSAAGQLVAGGSVLCAVPFDAGLFPDWVAGFRPTWYTGGPALHRSILALCRERPDVAAQLRLRVVRSIGAALPAGLLHELQSTFQVPVIEGYGLTEAGTVASVPLSPYACKPGSAGRRVWPGVEIMDDAGNFQPPGATGEIVLRGPTVFHEYRNDPAATRDAFRDGWFRTGDLGYFDRDGYLFVTGRIKEMINRGGEKVLPGEIDEALLAHPGVADAAAFRIPHPQLGDDVAAAVVPRAGVTIDESELHKFLSLRLAAFKVPRVVMFVSQLPKSATGKPQRSRLAEQYGELCVARAAQSAPLAPQTEQQRMLAQIWSAVLGVPVPDIGLDFFELGGHSLAAARLVARIEESFGVHLSQDALISAPTIRLQAEWLTRMNGAPRSPLVIHSDRPGTAFFMVRPLTIFRALFAAVGKGRPIIGLTLPTRQELGGDADWPDLARMLMSAMREHQPSGPYCIGGWCADGVLAFEMARQLAANGESVSLLALFDSPCPVTLKDRSRRRTWRSQLTMLRWQANFQWASLRQLGRREVVAYLRERAFALLRRSTSAVSERLRRKPREYKAWGGWHLPSGVRLRISTYECLPYPGALTLFCAEGSRGAGYADFPAYGWEGLATRGTHVHWVPGDHLTMFLEPNVTALSNLLTEELARAESPAPLAADAAGSA